MKWTRETSGERYDRLTDWHEWFAWRPIRLSSFDQMSQEFVDTREIIWCETVMRKLSRSAHKTYATKEDALLDKLTENKNEKEMRASIHKMFQQDDNE
jgi:hypothetical protein|tara:strand:- start:429 stop:722 length:294 start_codon:yes stop_codon:yes gene_type:complete